MGTVSPIIAHLAENEKTFLVFLQSSLCCKKQKKEQSLDRPNEFILPYTDTARNGYFFTDLLFYILPYCPNIFLCIIPSCRLTYSMVFYFYRETLSAKRISNTPTPQKEERL